MAVAFDARTRGTGTASPVTWTHTPVATPSLVLVWITIDCATQPTISAVSYGGTACIFSTGLNMPGTTQRQELWYLVTTVTGGKTVSISWTGGTSVTVWGDAETFTGSDIAVPLGTVATNSQVAPAASPMTVTVTGATNDLIADSAFLAWTTTPTITVGSGQTSRWNDNDATTFTSRSGSTEPGAASVVMDWTFTGAGTNQWSTMGVAVKAFATVIPAGVDIMIGRRYV